MEFAKNKKAIAIAIFLSISIATSMILIPTTSAHDPAWEIPTFAYINVAPNPVGVGQTTYIVVWIDKVIDGTTVTNNIRFHNYKVVITAPDGATETITWDTVSDTTSSAYTTFTPDQTGTYTINFTFPGQAYTDYEYSTTSAYVNDTYLASTATTYLTVQEDAVSTAVSTALPTEYWSRPIYGQNSDWYTISSNWLGGFGYTYTYKVQPDGTAPDTSHIMWSKELQIGGTVGGTTTDDGTTYYAGESYESRFDNPLIIDGNLYYPLDDSSTGTAPYTYLCVDLQTGEEVWSQDYYVYPSVGCILDFDSGNQHGATSYLIAISGTTWIIYDPADGEWLFNITNVPSGTYAYGDNGEILIYQLDSTNGWLACWNLTQVITNGAVNAETAAGYRPVGKTLNSAERDSYSWNITLSSSIPSGSSIIKALPGDLLLAGTSPTNIGTAGSNTAYTAWGTLPYTVWAISLDEDTLGDLEWIQKYGTPDDNITRSYGLVDTVNRVFTMYDKETMQWSGYDLDSGNLLWGPVGNATAYQYYSYYDSLYCSSTAYGNLYVAGFGGLVYCYDTSNGDLLWIYGNGDDSNSTNDALTAWGYRPTFISNIADGKIYLFNNEHSPDSPLYKNARIRCLNATTGKEIWSTLAWSSSTTFYFQAGVIADGYLAYFNAYDGRVYSVGKGASQTTVEAPLTAVTAGESIVIQGTVMDISAGTTQEEQAARFPNGVACVSDESMDAWMEYVYMQQEKPTNATGVTVQLYVLDANDNFRSIGTTTTDLNGYYSYNWVPDISGAYTVYAVFEGSESYYGSQATAAFAVDEPAATATPVPVVTLPPTEMYFAISTIAIILAIAILGLLMLKRKP